MKKASNYAFLQRKRKEDNQEEKKPNPVLDIANFGGLIIPKTDQDLNVFVVTFDGMKNAEQNLSGGDPYECKKCQAVLNKYSKVLSAKQYQQIERKQMKHELKSHESYWECEFCSYPNILQIQKEEIPKKDDVIYMLESAHENDVTENDSTIVFCIDTSGSMNTTSEIEGKVDLKYGMSQQQIEMLKQFMEPGDEAQFNFLPGNQNKNKTFISRKQCILSAIENQLQELKKVDPLKKVGFVTFNNEVTIVGDGKSPTVNILGDKLYKKQEILNSLGGFKLTEPLGESYQNLINSLNKTQAKGQTALGPALLSSIEVAARGSPGSSVVLCTDGLANIGVGTLDPFQQNSPAFYKELAQFGKEKNIVINIITIKGQSAKMQVIGQLAKDTNGNIKVVNPEKLQDDFANVLKDQVVGLNVSAKIMLHKAMVFRNESTQNLKDSKTVMVKELPNATVNTRISFEYELREEEDLKFMEIDIDKLKKVPFQAQVIYVSPKGGKFLRVISSESETTTEKEQMKKDANIGVVHQRVASNTAAMFSKGDSIQSMAYNDMWSNYLNNEFREEKYTSQQDSFNTRNNRLRGAVQQRSQRINLRQSQKPQQQYGGMVPPPPPMMAQMIPPKRTQMMAQMQEEKPSSNVKSDFSLSMLSHISEVPQIMEVKESEIKPAQNQNQENVCLDSDEEEQQLMENMMEKQCFDLD